MKYIVSLILIIIIFTSCKTTKTTITTSYDSTNIETKIDTLVLIKQDTVQFDSLLQTYLLLEEMVDSLESLPKSEVKYIKDSRSRALYEAYKNKYLTEVKLRKGANIDSDYIIKDSISITTSDTTYYKYLDFTLKIREDSIGLQFNHDFKVLSSQTTITEVKNRKITFIAWLGSKYTLTLLSIFLVLIIIQLLKIAKKIWL